MKKITAFITICVLSFILAACNTNNEKTIHVVATQIPHEEILKQAEPLLKERGYTLKITVTDDYGIPNPAVAKKSADANFFQHVPFFDKYNLTAKDSEKLVNVGDIHIEPIVGYSKKVTNTNEITASSKILISSSEPDHGRVLAILKEKGLVKLKEGVNTLTATLNDIIEQESILNKTNFKQVLPELLVTSYKTETDIDLAFINGNFALEANLPQKENIVVESPDNNPYVNIIAVLKGNENSPKIKVLVEVLKSQTIKDFINNEYQGSVIPA